MKTLRDEVRADIERVIREMYGDWVLKITMKLAHSPFGDENLYIHVYLDDDMPREKGGKLGRLLVNVSDLMGEELDGVFPTSAPCRRGAWSMSDRTIPEGLIATAWKLCARVDGKPPTQADLRRALSTAYYAQFHALSRLCADTIAGGEFDANRNDYAWDESYRGLIHGVVVEACRQIKGNRFPAKIREFAAVFEFLRQARESADYDSAIHLYEFEVIRQIKVAEAAIAGLDTVPVTEQRRFVARILINTKGAKETRKRTDEGKPAII